LFLPKLGGQEGIILMAIQEMGEQAGEEGRILPRAPEKEQIGVGGDD
jgi:hypothetical protein